MSTAIVQNTVSDDQLARYAKLIYERTGIYVSPQKKTLLSNRVRRRLRATGIECFEEYFKHVSKLNSKDPEWDAFLQEVTTHETYLFRDPTHWDWLGETYLSEIASQARANQRPKRLRFWSAACSTGDEAYTIALCLADHLMNSSTWEIDILGTDIGIGALEEAEAGHFSERAMQHVSESLRRRFFSKGKGAASWTARPALSDWLRFQQHNLLDPIQEGPFDLIFLKNVLIYFDEDSKKKALQNVLRALQPGGFLVVGPAEGVSRLLGELERVSSWLYQKPDRLGNPNNLAGGTP